MIQIGNVTLPPPSSYTVSRHDLDSENSGRNERGVLLRDRLRGSTYKIELAWNGISNSKLNTILNAISPAKVQVKFLSENTQTSTTGISMYAGDKTMELVRYMNSRNKMAWNLKFNLIEY